MKRKGGGIGSSFALFIIVMLFCSFVWLAILTIFVKHSHTLRCVSVDAPPNLIFSRNDFSFGNENCSFFRSCIECVGSVRFCTNSFHFMCQRVLRRLCDHADGSKADWMIKYICRKPMYVQRVELVQRQQRRRRRR